jgi:hypothetical protein
MGEMEERKREKEDIVYYFLFFLSPFLLISLPPFLPPTWQDKKKYQRI